MEEYDNYRLSSLLQRPEGKDERQVKENEIEIREKERDLGGKVFRKLVEIPV